MRRDDLSAADAIGKALGVLDLVADLETSLEEHKMAIGELAHAMRRMQLRVAKLEQRGDA